MLLPSPVPPGPPTNDELVWVTGVGAGVEGLRDGVVEPLDGGTEVLVEVEGLSDGVVEPLEGGTEVLPGGVDPGGVLPGGVDPGGVLPGGVEPGGVDPGGVEPGGVLVSVQT